MVLFLKNTELLTHFYMLYRFLNVFHIMFFLLFLFIVMLILFCVWVCICIIDYCIFVLLCRYLLLCGASKWDLSSCSVLLIAIRKTKSTKSTKLTPQIQHNIFNWTIVIYFLHIVLLYAVQ